MPKATVSKLTETHQLTTLPAVDGEEGGWVELRRLSYGEKLKKDAEAMKMRFGLDTETKGIDAEVSMINVFVTLLEFNKCIMDHNLTNEAGAKLNFSKEEDVQALDPRVGDEISTIIGKMNDFDSVQKPQGTDATGK